MTNEQKIYWVKAIHIFMFIVFTLSVLICAYSAATGVITKVTWIAFVLVLIEGLVLIARGWVCPLTEFAEHLGAETGAITQYLMPEWLSERVFKIWGAVYVLAALIILWRVFV